MNLIKRDLSFNVWLILGMVLVCSVGRIHAQEAPQAVFDRANNLLEQGNYSGALSIYQTLEQDNQISGSLYLNMGISYIRLDSLGKAKYYFLKARKFDETRERADKGLQYVNSRFSRQSAVLPKLPWQQFLDWLNEVLGSTTVLALGLLFLNIGVLGFVAHWFLKKYQQYFKMCGVSFAIAGLLIILTGFYLKYLDNRYTSAVMVHQQANVREDPTPSASIVSQAYEGYTFTVDLHQSKDREGWKYVRMSNGLYGWIQEENLMTL